MKIKLDDYALEPTRAHDTDAGLDIRSPIDMQIPPHDSRIFKTGVHVQLPPGTAGLMVSKSGLNVNHDITSTGLIDEGYDGEIIVKLYNHGPNSYSVKREDKISQLIVIPVAYLPVEIVDSIEGGERVDAGFGSTGR